jgi:drug/metabolite transporter (DMT)-like permease
MNQPSDSVRRQGADYALLIVLACLWASSFTFIKIGVESIPPLSFMAARVTIAALCLTVIMWLWRLRFPMHAGFWKRVFVQSILGIVIPFTFIGWAELSIDASLATILNATVPIFAFLLTVFVTRHETVPARKVLGVAVGMAGVCAIVGFDALNGVGQQVAGQLKMLVASLGYAAAAIYGRRLTDADPITTATGMMFCAAAVLVPLGLIFDTPWTLAPSADSLLALLGLSVFSTAIAYIIYFRLIHALGTVGTTAQSYLRVPIGVMIGMIFLGEMLNIVDWMGMACILLGVAAMTVPRREVAR